MVTDINEHEDVYKLTVTLVKSFQYRTQDSTTTATKEVHAMIFHSI